MRTVMRLCESSSFDSVSSLERWAEYDMGVELRIWDERNHLFIQYIERSEDSPQGNGKKVLDAVVAYADQNNLPVSLSAQSSELMPYFEKFGFVVQDASTRLMRRASRATVEDDDE